MLKKTIGYAVKKESGLSGFYPIIREYNYYKQTLG
jgi:hypothetical protein